MNPKISFFSGHIRLVGSLTLPTGPGHFPVMVVAHASQAGGRQYEPYQHLVQNLPQHGIGVMLFDRRGSGESEGDFSRATFDDLARDLLSAAQYAANHPDVNSSQVGLWGMSQGSWLAPLAATISNRIAFVIAVSAVGVSPAEQMNYSAAYALREAGFVDADVTQMLALRRQIDNYYRGQATLDVVQESINRFSDRPWFSYAYIDEQLPMDVYQTKWYQEMDFDPRPTIAKLAAPTLLIYGEDDPWVPIEQSINIWKCHSTADLTVARISDANHFMMSISASGLQSHSGQLAGGYLETILDWLVPRVR